MRRSRILVAAGLLAVVVGAPLAVRAEHEAAEGGAGHEVACTAESSEEECLEFWESHVNWWSWDYRGGADQAPEHRHMPPPFGFALINFFIFGAIMYRLAAQPLKEFVRTRHVTIKRDIEEAAALHREAEQRLREYEARIAGLDLEIETLLSQVRKEAEEEKARIVAGAEQQALRLKADAEAQIANELARVRRELKAEVVDAAIAVAERMMAEKLGIEDQARLAERFVGELEGPKAASAARS